VGRNISEVLSRRSGKKDVMGKNDLARVKRLSSQAQKRGPESVRYKIADPEGA